MDEQNSGGIDPRLSKFRWNLNAMVRWEKVRGCSIDKADPASMTDFRTMVWAGIEAQVPGLTEDDVGGMINMHNAGEVRAMIDAQMNPEAAKNQ